MRQPKILILDDSASALDFAPDAKLRRAIAKDTEGMTVFIVSQRAASIMQAIRFLLWMMEESQEREHIKKLLASCQVYQEICYSQLSKEEVEHRA